MTDENKVAKATAHGNTAGETKSAAKITLSSLSEAQKDILFGRTDALSDFVPKPPLDAEG